MFSDKINNIAKKIKGIPSWAVWALWALAALAGAMVLVYFWRVLYYLDSRGDIPIKTLTLGAGALALALVGAVALVKRCRTLPLKGAVTIFLCGLLFVFANPPMQAPDEYNYYLRAYSISQGHLDFDGSRQYPQDVALLYQEFPGAWVNAHTSSGMGEDEKTGEEEVYNSAGYALKQYGEDGPVQSVVQSFQNYLAGEKAKPITEPIVVMVLPFVPQAVGMALARLFGLGALGCLYGGRLVNLLAYAAIGYLTLKNTRRSAPLFLAFLLLPLSLFLAGSLSYDATLLGCYYLMLSFLEKEKFTTRDGALFLAAFGWVNMAKPFINLLWIFVPLVVAAKGWKPRLKRWQFGGLGLALALGITVFTSWYGNFFRHDYDLTAFARMIEGADQIPQLFFVLKHIPRYLAVMAGTLYENDFFIGQLGSFGALDLTVPLLNVTGPVMLLTGAVLSIPQKHQRLAPLTLAGLGGFGVVYWAGAMTAMYITYTPVSMIRIIGLQARYFLPVFLGFYWLAAQGLGRYLTPAKKENDSLALGLFGGYAVVGAVLLFQHYFIGPIYTIG